MTRVFNLSSMILALTCIGLHSSPGTAMGLDEASLCDAAAHNAAQLYDVPVDILLSIARVESGRSDTNVPWPWTVNAGGQGYWFETSRAAIDFAENQQASGTENFDVGCFQINLHWHPQAFDSLETAFDPSSNAIYAAKFLTSLFQTEGDWKSAVAAYHSRTPENANDYIKKVESAYYNTIKPAEILIKNQSATLIAPKQNRFPLLKNGGNAELGSLVPRQNASVVFIGETP